MLTDTGCCGVACGCLIWYTICSVVGFICLTFLEGKEVFYGEASSSVEGSFREDVFSDGFGYASQESVVYDSGCGCYAWWYPSMSCYHPLRLLPGGGRSSSVTVPCGQCVGCRLERSRQWAIRCLHESQLYEFNCSITLTYSPFFCPSDFSVSVRHFQLFMKRLRKASLFKIRFFHCGEYGRTVVDSETGEVSLGRPHYHAILFNCDFIDKVRAGSSPGGLPLYQSDTLDEIWGMGRARIGDVTFESCAYVARYILKKLGNDGDFKRLDGRAPEYVTMSRRPGIGAGWFDKFRDDVFPSEEVVVRGRKCRPPRFYDELLRRQNPVGFAELKARRLMAKRDFWESCKPRLEVKEAVAKSGLSKLKRPLEGEL